jgi:nucleoid DNA-binding protein
MADIFISYSRRDYERVYPVAKLIADAGWSIFIDTETPVGVTWRQHIFKALTEAKCVVVVWSKRSIESDWVIEEADDGKKRKILIPVLIDPIKPPFGFRSIQHVDLSKWHGQGKHPNIEKLLKGINRYAGKPNKRKSSKRISPSKSGKPIAPEDWLKSGITSSNKDLVKKIARDAKVSEIRAAAILDSITAACQGELNKRDGKISIVGLGTFTKVHRKARKGRNPQTGEPIKIKAKNVVKFKPGKKLLDNL